MDKDELEGALNDPKESNIPVEIISAAKLKRLRNLKYFRDYTDDQIIAYVKNKDKNKVPPVNPADIISDAPDEVQTAVADINLEEFKKKFDTYLKKYRKEFGVDINDANDAESLRSLVRYVIQQELIDTAILKESSKTSPHPGTLKALGDFQRTVQQNVNEIQDKLGISRKIRKDKQVDDIPQYIKSLQDKAAKFWERSTVPIRCEKCRIELARYWVNFPDTVTTVRFEMTCDKCKEKIIYAA
jgi:hypothetical protein